MPTDLPLTADAAWRAVTARDRAWDGRFVYGVRTTGIYCRPSCPSRRALRENMSFYPTAEAARGAGFRACKRCRPDTAAEAGNPAVARARDWLDRHAGERVSLAHLATVSGVSAWHLQRTFKREVGLSPREYAAALRADRLRAALRAEPSVSRAVYEAGFGSSSRVYEGAHRLLGMTPGRYREGGKGMELRYTIVPSPHGRLLVAATDRGVAAVLLGESDAALTRDLARQFPEAERARVDTGDEWLRELVRGVAAEVARPGSGGGLPLDLHGTAFQWKVWRALTTIPAGETRTYTELARSVGRPRAVRAVASACAANRVAVLVPCHRVVRSDGSLGGYRWGLERKARLLAREQATG
ncbi:MAG: bifunctional DNA-binding transcriptional regulator/O6-methylguanine-DNA methyltransferase Ada [Gemmatimonadetes bacterium]|nr:bifunctional DNA-binding transcriptional regulator/O6-methylguanine-DNA methyltransferase Ada [Gemmatimonadota bacterium]